MQSNADATWEARQQQRRSAVERQREWEASRPTFSLTQAPTIESEGYGGFSTHYIVGVLQYNGDRQLSSISVTCQVYYQGVQIADSLDIASGLQPRSKWRFRAMILEDVSRYDDIVCQADGF